MRAESVATGKARLISARLDETSLRRLMDAGRGLVNVRDREAVLDRVLQTAFELTGARHAALAVLDERHEHVELMLTHGADEEQQAIRDLPLGRTVLGLLIDNGRPMRLDDVSKHAVAHAFADGHPQMRSFAGAPILVRGEAWGTLYVTDKQGDRSPLPTRTPCRCSPNGRPSRSTTRA